MNWLPADPTTTSSLTAGMLPVIARVTSIADSAAAAQATETNFAETKENICQALTSGAAPAIRRRLLDALARQLGATAVAIGWQRSGERRWLAVASNLPTFDRRSPLGRALQAACAETALQGESLAWPTRAGERSVPPTYRQLAEQTGAAQVIGYPLPLIDGKGPAVLLAWGEALLVPNSYYEQEWNEILRFISGLVHLLDDATPSAATSYGNKLLALMRGSRRWLVVAAAIVFGALAFLPVPDRVNCFATLEPQLRRYVVAPFDATLEKSLVRTGDQVTAGQPLARLDERPLQMELAVLQGERDEASRRRDAARAKGQAAVTQMAELETEQITAKIKHLQHQQQQLSVVSPIAGIVVRGELERVEGAPLTRGNSMFEIAPLDHLIAELALPEDEVNLITPGMAVTLWPAAQPGRTLAGTIGRVHPRAEVRDGQSVFIAEVVLDNQSQLLRPGMQASAIVWSQTQPLGWTLIRRPYARLTRWMWW